MINKLFICPLCGRINCDLIKCSDCYLNTVNCGHICLCDDLSGNKKEIEYYINIIKRERNIQ